MKVRKDGIGLNAPGFPIIVKQIGTKQVNEFRITVGVAATSLNLATAPTVTMFILRNVSAAGQMIRIGNAPNFTPGLEQGMLLYPGDAYTLSDIAGLPGLSAIADAAGALLEKSHWQI